MKIRYWYISLLVVVVVVSQIILLRPHLKYGFSDVDWGFLSIYKTQNPYSVRQFIDNFKTGGTRGGVYTHQIYYIGAQSELFGLNFRDYQITTHVFKILATLSAAPFFLIVSGSAPAAFLATLFFGFSYSTVGTMYTVVTSSDYPAYFSMGIFILAYWYAVKKNTGSWFLLFSLLLLLIITLFLSTERMYQLPVFIGLAEVFLLLQKRNLGTNTIKRLAVIFVPLIFLFLIQPKVFLSFLQHGAEIAQGVVSGDWNLLLTPFIVLGSIIIPNDYTKFLGVARIDSLGSFLSFLVNGPLPVLAVTTVILAVCVFKRAHIRIIQILFLTFILWAFVYISGSHFVSHFINIESVTQALAGVYILAVAAVSFISWREDQERLLIGLFVGPFLAFLYILLTWVGASAVEIFSGAHRYLTIPAMLMSLFLGSLYGVIFKRLKFFAVIPLILLMTLFIKVNAGEISAFFNAGLHNGFGAEDKKLMRQQLINLTPDLSSSEPALFYFDFSEDADNGYFYDNTLLGGFSTWMLWHPRINMDEDIAPKAFWNDPKKLKEVLAAENIKQDNFYAFQLKDKKVLDIKEQILNKLIPVFTMP